MPQKRLEDTDKSAYREAVNMSRVRSNNSHTRGEDICCSKQLLQSESKRQFQGETAY